MATPSLTAKEFGLVCRLWRNFFPHDLEPSTKDDQRVRLASTFFEFFMDQRTGGRLLTGVEWCNHGNVFFDCHQLETLFNFQDFMMLLRTRPYEMIGSIGFALGLVADRRFPFGEPLVLTPRFAQFEQPTPYAKLKSNIIGQLCSLRGYVVKVSAPRPLIEGAQFVCGKCGKGAWVRFQDGIYEPPQGCSVPCRAKHWQMELNRRQVQTSVYQRIKLQELEAERDGAAAAGLGGAGSAEESQARIPKTFEVEARGILVNQCTPGDVVQVVGIIKASQCDAPRAKDKESALHTLYVLGNTLRIIKGSADGSLAAPSSTSYSSSQAATQGGTQAQAGPSQPMTGMAGTAGTAGTAGMASGEGHRSTALTPFSDEELSLIQQIALHEGCLGLLVSSLCPSIFGHELVKMGLLLGLLGGTQRSAGAGGDARGGERGLHVRSDVHVLVVGDPGIGKSQLLRAAAAVAPRSVMVCGNTATTAGLTVTVTREPGKNGSGEVCLEAGALVLADQGVCCIDELDKMTCDHHALLEAMEQQSISVAKSGVVTSIRTRASVLAAANPAGGSYNKRKTVCENLKMPSALLSRFDLVFILLDKRDAAHDRMISEHIIKVCLSILN